MEKYFTMNSTFHLRNLTILLGCMLLSACCGKKTLNNLNAKGLEEIVPFLRFYADITASPETVYPKDKRIPLGMDVFPVGYNKSETILKIPSFPVTEKRLLLRLTPAIDFREEVSIEIFSPKSNRVYGYFEFCYAYPLQPFECSIDPAYQELIKDEGIGLRMTKGTTDVWFYASDDNVPEVFRPHILFEQDFNPETEFLNNLYSMSSMAPFGWIGGCVIDGLHELEKKGENRAKTTLDLQLSYFLDSELGVRYENPRTMPMDGRFNSIEDFLPVAAIVHLYPEHPVIDLALEYISKTSKDEKALSSEGCYTIAYTLANIAAVRNDKSLADEAVELLQKRINSLISEKTIYQHIDPDGNRHFKNWGRGVVWYLLGTIKTLCVLEESGLIETDTLFDIKTQVLSDFKWVLSYRDRDGLWCNYIDDPSTGIDTSTSAGIATAVAYAIEKRYLTDDFIPIVEKTYDSLLQYVTCDGYIIHSSQINRGGEGLQRGDCRVMAHYTTGLMAQLYAFLKQNR